MPTSAPHDPRAWGQDFRVQALVSAGSMTEAHAINDELVANPIEDKTRLMGIPSTQRKGTTVPPNG